jgi:hypothetical protein
MIRQPAEPCGAVVSMVVSLTQEIIDWLPAQGTSVVGQRRQSPSALRTAEARRPAWCALAPSDDELNFPRR